MFLAGRGTALISVFSGRKVHGKGADGILGIRVPFWPMVVGVIALAICGDAMPQQATAPAEKPGERFLKLSENERYFWFEGAARTLSTWVASFDKPKGDCIARWYIRDRDAKRKLIESEIARDPKRNEAVVFLSLVIQACGDIVPRAR
jgi:hypothetical protein